VSKYVLTPEADQDLDDIWEYIAQDDIEAADRWDAKLREAFQVLARNPLVGHTRKDLTDKSVLFWPVGSYLIIYRNLAESIEIVAVTQGARDIPSYLRRRT
jgi:plasmid stabilization system protein ParE